MPNLHSHAVPNLANTINFLVCPPRTHTHQNLLHMLSHLPTRFIFLSAPPPPHLHTASSLQDFTTINRKKGQSAHGRAKQLLNLKWTHTYQIFTHMPARISSTQLIFLSAPPRHLHTASSLHDYTTINRKKGQPAHKRAKQLLNMKNQKNPSTCCPNSRRYTSFSHPPPPHTST